MSLYKMPLLQQTKLSKNIGTDQEAKRRPATTAISQLNRFRCRLGRGQQRLAWRCWPPTTSAATLTTSTVVTFHLADRTTLPFELANRSDLRLIGKQIIILKQNLPSSDERKNLSGVAQSRRVWRKTAPAGRIERAQSSKELLVVSRFHCRRPGAGILVHRGSAF